MHFKFLFLFAGALVGLIFLLLFCSWVDRLRSRRFGVAFVVVMGAAIAFQLKFPEIIARVVG